MKGNIVDIEAQQIYYGQLAMADGKIIALLRLSDTVNPSAEYIMPGFIDSHVHIESSMLVPSEFARLAVIHGTTGTISDPHEIANVCGIQGVEYMIANGNEVPFKFHFGAPSCVPATTYETAGASLAVAAVTQLLQRNDIHYLSEMMNYPGVLAGDEEVLQKIAMAKQVGKPVDGHAPGLRGDEAKKYIDAIAIRQNTDEGYIALGSGATDHECFTQAEALEKLNLGMKILIREGSAAKNFDALIHLVEEHYENMMFCTDDMHPDSLLEGHINTLCARAVALGINVYKVLRVACINPILQYKMNNGRLRVGDAADFTIVKNLQLFEVTSTYINGQKVAEKGISLIPAMPILPINNFSCVAKQVADFKLKAKHEAQQIWVIEALEGQLITHKLLKNGKIVDGFLVSNVADDILKIVVVNRYTRAPVAISFIKNIGLQYGAIASSVAHDSHNIIAAGVDDESICEAVNLIINQKGGISASLCTQYFNAENDATQHKVLPLPIAGLMSDSDGVTVARAYTDINNFATARLGSPLQAPFMTLSFMALLVIPHVKLSDKGLFDSDTFNFIAD